jgi:ADP-ribose pyrophosphatase YjhB (NUDIX family)
VTIDDPDNLNPALAEARFCPRCGAPDLDVAFPRSLHCAVCGHHAFYNPKPVASAILRDRDDADRIWLLRRGFDPGAGRWTFPGGFVDLGESVEEAAHREAMEEVGVAITINKLVGVYSRPRDRIVLIVFEATAHATPGTSPEATEVRSFTAQTLPWDELAFWSTTAALRDATAEN